MPRAPTHTPLKVEHGKTSYVLSAIWIVLPQGGPLGRLLLRSAESIACTPVVEVPDISADTLFVEEFSLIRVPPKSSAMS
jgi:hypothetical protein